MQTTLTDGFSPLETHCMEAGACGDQDCQAYLAGIHAISRELFDEMKNAFFESENPPADAMIAADRLDLEVACNRNFVATSPDSIYNRTTNDDLKPRIEAGSYDPGPFDDFRFSIALFRGIRRMFRPEQYFFSKGRTGSAVHIMVRAVRSGRDVYVANLSNIFPIHSLNPTRPNS